MYMSAVVGFIMTILVVQPVDVSSIYMICPIERHEHLVHVNLMAYYIYLIYSDESIITVRKNRRGKWTIQRNWQHRVYKTKTNKTKTQHNICWTPLYANKHK